MTGCIGLSLFAPCKKHDFVKSISYEVLSPSQRYIVFNIQVWWAIVDTCGKLKIIHNLENNYLLIGLITSVRKESECHCHRSYGIVWDLFEGVSPFLSLPDPNKLCPKTITVYLIMWPAYTKHELAS